jgi:diguanylate cyclase (GGDEF)-like protein/PAS domain S-box-containing protein
MRRNERERQDALQVFDRLFHGSPTPMTVGRLPERRFTDVNAAMLETFGYSLQEVLGRTSDELGLFADPRQEHEIMELLAAHGRVGNREVRVRCKDGATRDCLFSGEIIESQKRQYSLMILSDQTERRRSEEQARQHHQDLLRLNDELAARAAALEEANATITRIAATDDLTGLANRRHFYESLEKAVSLARRHVSPLSLVSLDLDGLKEVNDGDGHAAGDAVLRSFAVLLDGLCRTEDLAARLGGDEFGLLLPGIDLGGAHRLAERVLQAVRACEGLHRNSVTASAGVAAWHTDDRPHDLLRRADEALYAAKRGGGDTVADAG